VAPEAGASHDRVVAGTQAERRDPATVSDEAGSRDFAVASAEADAHDLAAARARAEARELTAGRPEVREMVVRSLLPPWLSTRYLGSLKASGALMLVGAAGSLVANLGAPWYFHLIDLLLLALGAGTVRSVVGHVSVRRVEATRLRVHGPDECDTLADAGVRITTRPRWREAVAALFDLLVLTLPVVVAVRAWSEGGWPARVAAVLAVGCVIAGSVLIVHSARTAGQWRRDFLAEEGLELPPVRDGWDVLLR